MADWVTSTVESMGYIGVAVLMFLENVFPPLPSEIIMPFAGFAAARGELTYIGVVIAGTIGSALGQLPLYYLGRSLGIERTKRFTARYCRWIMVEPADIDRAMAWFARRGGAAVFLCRLVPGVRSLISIPAGAQRMGLLPFMAYSTAGMGIWAAALAFAGQVLGRNYDAVEKFLGPVTYVVLAILAVAAVVWFIRRKRARAAGGGGAGCHSESSSNPRRASSEPSAR